MTPAFEADTLLARVRAAALQLPGTLETAPGTFAVEGATFARLSGTTLTFGIGEAYPAELPLADDPDWQLVEDRIARSWELTAPAGLLEAGGR